MVSTRTCSVSIFIFLLLFLGLVSVFLEMSVGKQQAVCLEFPLLHNNHKTSGRLVAEDLYELSCQNVEDGGISTIHINVI